MNLDQIILGIIILVFVIFFVLYIIKMMKGKIDIQLEKFEYTSGENIKGIVTLKLKKEVEAEELRIGILGERKQRLYGKTSTTTKDIIYEFKKAISGEKIYPARESKYEFDLKIPNQIASKINTGNALVDTMVNSVQSFGGLIKWYIIAELEVKGFNLKRRVQINIT